MTDIYAMLLEACYSIFNWMTSFEYYGVTPFHVCFFALFLGLMWRFILSPLFGSRGGSFGVSASDFVKDVKRNSRRK